MQELILSILFDLLKARKTTAPYLAEKYGVSTRTIYRCVDKLSAFAPLRVQRGRQGGVFLSDCYRLPVDFLSEEEYESVISALCLAYANQPKESYLSAKRKISAAQKEREERPLARLEAGDVVVLPSEGENSLAEKLRCAQAALKERKILRISVEEENGRKEYAVEPHLLALQGGEWYLCGFSYLRRGFYPFPFSKIHGVFKTADRFRVRKFTSEELLSGIPCMR